MPISNIEFFARDTMSGGRNDYSAYHEISPQLSSWGLHSHDFYEFYIHYRGGRQMTFGSETYLLQPNQLMIFPPFSMHGLSDAGDLRDYERAYLSVTPEFLEQLSFGRTDLNAIFSSAVTNHRHQFLLGEEDANRCRQLLTEMQDHVSDKDDYENIARMVTFLGIIKRVVGDREAIIRPSSTGNIMQDVLVYVNDHYTSRISLKSIAEHFNISVSYLSHGFVAYTNWSVYDYIMYRRIALAQILLRSDQSITEISSQCGFSDYSSFLKKFSATTGVSPKEYRARLQN